MPNQIDGVDPRPGPFLPLSEEEIDFLVNLVKAAELPASADDFVYRHDPLRYQADALDSAYAIFEQGRREPICLCFGTAEYLFDIALSGLLLVSEDDREQSFATMQSIIDRAVVAKGAEATDTSIIAGAYRVALGLPARWRRFEDLQWSLIRSEAEGLCEALGLRMLNETEDQVTVGERSTNGRPAHIFSISIEEPGTLSARAVLAQRRPPHDPVVTPITRASVRKALVEAGRRYLSTAGEAAA